MIDAHAHIHDAKFDIDREEMIARAREAGVRHIVTIGTSVEDSRRAIDLARRFPDMLRASVAVHPHEYSKLPSEEIRREWMEELEVLAREDIVAAIGECGLDYHAFGGEEVSSEQRSVQREGFLEHIRLAERIGKPLVIHARESYEDVLEALKDTDNGQWKTDNVSLTMEQEGRIRQNLFPLQGRGIPFIILHCYQGDAEVTQRFLELSDEMAGKKNSRINSRILFSFAGNVTYPVKKAIRGTKDDIEEVVRRIPIDRILVETDCPYLAPQSRRNERNEPAFVEETAQKIAEIQGVSMEEVERGVEENFKNVFLNHE